MQGFSTYRIGIRRRLSKSVHICRLTRALAACIHNIWMLMQSDQNEPRHEISNNVICATSKASDQPGHKRSLIRGFASRLDIL